MRVNAPEEKLGSWSAKPTLAVGTWLRHWAFRVLVVAIVGLAIGYRSDDITQWPMQFHLTLQYENALTARRIWLNLRREPISADEERWLDGWNGRLKAPPVLEFLTAVTYLMGHHERPWVATVFTSAFWLLGGVFLVKLLRRVGAKRWGIVAALLFYLLSPFAVAVSRSFQHEALMVFTFLLALCVLVGREQLTGWRGTLVAGVVCGMSALAKPGILLLPLLSAYAALRIQSIGFGGLLSSGRTYAFALLTVAPSVGYALVALRGESHQLLPQLLLQGMFYRWWAWNIIRVTGWMPLLLGIAGAWLLALRRRNFLGLGLLAGYVGYALLFTYANMTHDYYLVPLLVILAICLSVTVDALVQAAVRLGGSAAVIDAAAIAVCAAVLVAQGASHELPPPEDPAQARREREIGVALGPGSRVLSLSRAYGYELMYNGWLLAYWWPTWTDKWYEELRASRVIPDDLGLQRMLAVFRPSYFVITDLDDLAGQFGLADLLRTHYCVRLYRPHAIVYDLTQPCRVHASAS